MLAITRKLDEVVDLFDLNGNRVGSVRVTKLDGQRCTLALDTPDLLVMRRELFDQADCPERELLSRMAERLSIRVAGRVNQPFEVSGDFPRLTGGPSPRERGHDYSWAAPAKPPGARGASGSSGASGGRGRKRRRKRR